MNGMDLTPPTRLWNRSFTVWLLGSAQSQLGGTLSSLAMSFFVLEKTGSAGGVALTLAFSLLPNLLAPVAGALIDRVHLKVPLVASDVVRGGLQLGLAAAALGGGLPVEVVYLVAFLNGLVGIFAMPAASSAVPALVPPEDLPRANGLVGGLGQGAGLLGLLLGGVLVGAVGPLPSLLIAAVSYLLMALAVGLLVQLPARTRPPGPRPALLAEVSAGLRLMRRSRLLTFLPLMALVVNAGFAPIQALMPAVMERGGYGAQGYGTLMAVSSLGMLLASGLFAWLGGRLRARPTAGLGLLLIGTGLAGMMLQPAYAGYLAAAFVLGLGLSLTNTPMMTLIGQRVPGAYLGRVFSVLTMGATLGMPLVLLALSRVADRYPPSLFFGIAAGTMVVMALVWLWVADEPAGEVSLESASA